MPSIDKLKLLLKEERRKKRKKYMKDFYINKIKPKREQEKLKNNIN